MAVEVIRIVLVVLRMDRIPCPLVAFRVEKNDVVYAPRLPPPLLGVAVGAGALPHDFVPEFVGAERGVEQQLQVVARRWVAVQVEAAGGLQDAVKLGHALRHHRQVGHHVVLAEEGAHRLEHVAELLRAIRHQLAVGELGLHAPVPGVVEGGDLGRRLLAALFGEQDVIRGVRVERRVEVDQVDALVLDLLAQDAEVVPEVELVLPGVAAVRRFLGHRALPDAFRLGWYCRAIGRGVSTPPRHPPPS